MENKREDIPFMEENSLEPFTLIYDVVKNIVFILLGALAAAMISYVVVNLQYVPEYTASTTFIVGSKDSNNSYSNISSTYQMAQTFGKILQSNSLETLICEQMQIDEVEADIQAEVVEETNMLMLSVTADNPREAYDTILAVMDNYTKVPFYSMSGATMNVLVEPQVPFAPDNYLDVDGTVKNAFLIGAAICAFLFAFCSYMHNTVKQESDIERKLDAKSFGCITYEQKYKTLKEFIAHKKGTIMIDSPLASFSFVESYRRLASKLEYQLVRNNGKVLVVTSAAENEGKSTVAANLAAVYAEQGKKVILIDGDIRRPSQFLIFGYDVDEKKELGEYLKDPNVSNDIFIEGERENLFFAGGKNCYSSSTERLQSGCLSHFLNVCKKNADIVVIDTPPAGLIADAQILGQHADGVLFVVRQNYIVAEEINEIMDDFRDNHIHIMGVVLNGVQTFSNVLGRTVGSHYGKYGYYGHYGYGRNRGK